MAIFKSPKENALRFGAERISPSVRGVGNVSDFSLYEGRVRVEADWRDEGIDERLVLLVFD